MDKCLDVLGGKATLKAVTRVLEAGASLITVSQKAGIACHNFVLRAPLVVPQTHWLVLRSPLAGCSGMEGQARVRKYMEGLSDEFREAFQGRSDPGRQWTRDELIGKGGLLIRNKYVLEFWAEEVKKMKEALEATIRAMKLR